MSIEYRKMTSDDIWKARRLWENESYLGVTHSDTEERLAAYIGDNMGLSYVAYDGDRLVGTALAGHDSRRSFINHLCVDSEYRRRGIASRLVDLCEEALSDELPLRSYVMVYKSNERALAFWKSHGYQMAEDIVVMKKDLPR